MTSSDLLLEGVELMLIGMGSVFTFLVILVIATTLMSRILGRFFPEAAPAPAAAAARPAAPAAVDAETIAVIGAAIKQHRAKRRS
ncbi:OadG family protein [Halopseudomonas phragmitis]|uniref:Probable oxaloacetate decarboxylase gamma chain n=2 Tax=Pseudomonadaceae TaxID=135621 RepID=A0A1V0B5E7_9GAMM|nr:MULTISPECIES: OadG family protein [Pseudomonadaceae]AQZ95121.1 oxaloacetate decarboxylase [Halopseudomonas phragmitis]RHW21961.1 oxaloacetate decarboxylase [Pseudomonas jilinensis]